VLTYPWGNDWDPTRCNFAAKGTGCAFEDKETDDAHARTAPVGSYSPKGDSPLGACDMAGNVAEWCEDWYEPYGQGDQEDPTGPATGERRVLRGGSWLSPPSALRSALRGWGNPVGRTFHVGFRVVLAPEP